MHLEHFSCNPTQSSNSSSSWLPDLPTGPFHQSVVLTTLELKEFSFLPLGTLGFEMLRNLSPIQTLSSPLATDVSILGNSARWTLPIRHGIKGHIPNR